MKQTRRRATAPKPVREVASAARLSLEKLAEALVAGQPTVPAPRERTALLRWLAQSIANTNPGISEGELAEQVAARLTEMAEAGDETARAVMQAPVMEFGLNLARISLALAGALSAPDPPTIPKQHRKDAIAATVLELTGWTSVDDEMVEAIYRWLFGDEAAFLVDADIRMEASLRILENPDLREVHVPHPETNEMVLVTRDDILEHTDNDGRVLEAAGRYERKQARWDGRLIRALRPYGDRSTSVSEAVRRAALDLGIAQDGRSFEEFAGLVVAAAEARHGATG
jgi:hypothetical protein